MIQQIYSWVIYPKKTKTSICKDICTPMFIEALFTIAKIWKQPKYPTIDEWIKKMWYIYTMEYYSAIKKEWNNAICSNMDGPRDCHTEWSKSHREREISYDTAYMRNLKKKWYECTYLQNRNRLTDFENKLMATSREGWGKG